MKLRKRTIGLFASCVCLTSISVFGQTLQAVAGVSTSTQVLCTNVQNSTATASASCQGRWNDGSGDFGSGNGTAKAAYGVLQSFGTAAETITSVATDTGTSTGSSFTDYLTFPGLTSSASLQATLSVSGTLSGDPSSTVAANVYLNGSSSCVLQVVKGSCTTSIPVSLGQTVTAFGSLVTSAIAGPGTDSSTLNFESKNYGARYAFVLVDSAGRKINVPIVAASGTKYPTN